jgi:hypothetical protein
VRQLTLLVLLVLLAGLVSTAIYRWLAALAFQYLTVSGVARRRDWQVDRLSGDAGRADFMARERRRRKKAWALLRQGRSGIREGYRTGVFGKTHAGTWQPELTVRGTWRARRFTASQSRRYELTVTGDTGPRRRVRRRASLSLAGSFPMCEATVTWRGRVLGTAPPAVADLVRARRLRFRGLRSDGKSISVELGRRIRRGRLFGALDYLSDAADRLTAQPPDRPG